MKDKVRLHLQTAKPQFVDAKKNVVLAPWAMPKANDICSAEVLPYYGSNPEILHENFRNTWSLYPRIIKVLAKELNSNLSVNNSLTDWEILLGFWLFYILDICFDKKSMLRLAFEHYEVQEVTLYNIEEFNIENATTYEFQKEVNGRLYHELIYSLLFKHLYNDSKAMRVGVSPPPRLDASGENPTPENFIKPYRFSFSESQFSLGKLRDCLAEPGHEEVPILRPVSPTLSPSIRNSIANQLEKERICETALCRLVAFSLPTCLLEGYKENVELANAHYPKNNGLIYTSNSYAHNDLFKFWVVASKKKGSKYVIGQHGNNYGNLKWNSTEVYEVRVSDFFISWGWRDKHPNIKVLPSIRLQQFAAHCPKPDYGSKRIIFLSYTLPSYQYFSYSIPQGNQHYETILSWIDFLEGIKAFDIVFRPLPANYYWNEKEFILQKCKKKTRLSVSQNKILYDDLKYAALCVISYSSTAILELIYAGFPFICFWNPNHWQMRPEMENSYQTLRDNGILHDTASSAADFINSLDDNIEEWWNSPTTREAIDTFCDSFLERNSNPEEKWKDCFEAILRS